ncbi:MAG: heparinase II/III family protein [Pseudomonadota bacterium]
MSGAAKLSLAETLRRRLRRSFSDPGALKAAFRKAQAGEILLDLETDETGRSDAGRQLVSGVFAFADQSLEPADPRALWRDASTRAPWRAVAHSFEWLDDLEALGGAAAAECARDLFDAWSRECGDRFDPVIWRDDVAARRLRALILHARLVAPRDPARRERALKVVSAHGHWLARRLEELEPGMPRLRVAAALAELSLAAQGWEAERDALSRALDDALSAGLLADGCPLSRAPEDALTLLRHMRLLRERYAAADVDAPPLLDAAIEALAMAVRFFRAADGGLPAFHGGGACADGAVEAELSRLRLPQSAPQSLSEGRYERMAGGRVAIYVDCGEAPIGPAAETGHASALSFEMSAGRRRVIVNCGSGLRLGEEWARFGRSAEAHSTLTLDGAPFTSAAEASGADAEIAAPLIAGPIATVGERKLERNGVWVLARHDGYFEAFGARVTRRLFLSVDGGDFRGEDSLTIAEGEMRRFERRLAKAPRAQRERGLPFTARFHLHPDIAAALVADGDAVTLRLPSDEVWVMRQAGGALSLARSVYLGDGGAPRESQQIVATAAARDAQTQMRWAFRRVGDAESAPKDVAALMLQDLEGDDLAPGGGAKTIASSPPKA